jgi:transcriptional regulator with XRE-family HTH domain
MCCTHIDVLLGKRIRHRRRLLNVTQAQLAAACGIRFQQVQKYESAANKLSVSRLVDIARALECEPGDFLRGLENP